MFKGVIFCSQCGRKHKHKKRAKKSVYVCSTYDNYGANKCSRNQVDEGKLIWLITGHFNIEEADLTEEFVRNKVEKILVTPNKNKIEIHYKDGGQSILSPSMLIR